MQCPFARRQGANPFRVIKQLRDKLKQPAAAMQVPIGSADEFEGVFDLVKWKAIRYEGESGCVSPSRGYSFALKPVAQHQCCRVG